MRELTQVFLMMLYIDFFSLAVLTIREISINVRQSSPRFLNLSTIDILGRITVFLLLFSGWGQFCACKMFSSNPSLHLVNAR